MQSPGPIVRERTEPHGAEPDPDAVEPLALRRTASAPVNAPGAVEGRSPIADPLEGIFGPSVVIEKGGAQASRSHRRFFRERLKRRRPCSSSSSRYWPRW